MQHLEIMSGGAHTGYGVLDGIYGVPLSRVVRLSLLMNARNASQLQATDPRDKVFSILSVTREEEARLIEIDYKGSIVAVFSQATFASCTVSGLFETFWCASRGQSAFSELPSWAIDFTAITSPYGMYTNEKFRKIAIPLDMAHGFNSPWLEGQLTRLHVPIVMLFTTKTCAAVQFSNTASKEHWYAAMCSLLPGQCRLSRLRNDHTNLAAFDERAEVADEKAFDRERAISNLLDRLDFGPFNSHPLLTFSKIFRWWTAYRNSALTDSTEDLDRILSFPGDSQYRNVELHNLVVAYGGLWKYNSPAGYKAEGIAFLFTTTSGFLGLSMQRVAANDRVAVLHDCPFPVLLRPKDEAFAFVGFVYIGDLLEGQLEACWQRYGPYTQEVILV